MRTATWVCIICCIAFTGSALAFSNQVTVGFQQWDWSEDYEEDSGFESGGDYKQDEFFASYDYFFTDVEDNGEPLDLLTFYSRSSFVYGDFYTVDREFDADDSDYSSDKDWTGYGLGGLIYVTPATGIGAVYFTQDGEWEDNDAVEDDSYDEDRDGWHILLRNYLNDSNRFSIRLSRNERDRDFDNGTERNDEYEWLVFSYDGVMSDSPNVFLGVDVGTGSRERTQSNWPDGDKREHDLTRFSITAGPVYRNFAIYFSYDYYDWDPDYSGGWKADETYYTISPRYWFSEQLRLAGALTYYSWDESGNDYDFEESGKSIEITLSYRF